MGLNTKIDRISSWKTRKQTEDNSKVPITNLMRYNVWKRIIEYLRGYFRHKYFMIYKVILQIIIS